MRPGLNHRFALLSDLSLGRNDRRLFRVGRPDLLGHARLIGVGIDLQERVSRRHGLIVPDVNLLDVTLNLGRHGHGVSLQIGVIGLLKEPAVGPPADPDKEQKDKDAETRQDQGGADARARQGI